MAHLVIVKTETLVPTTDIETLLPPVDRYASNDVSQEQIVNNESNNEHEMVVKREVEAETDVAHSEEECTLSKCNICDLYFTSSEEFALHERSHKMDIPYKCGVCGECFEAIGNLENHLKINHSHLKYIFKVSYTPKYVKKQKVKKKKVYLCDTCGKKFNFRFKYETHLRSHRGERPHKCHVCGNRYFQKAHLATHMMSHTGLKPHPCKICGHRFVSNSKLRKHSKVHESGKLGQTTLTAVDGATFKCGLCCLDIEGSENYYKHMDQHKQHRPFKCDICGKCYSRNSDLKAHAETHAGDKPFSCSVCKTAFDTKDQLAIHEEKHVDERPFECLQCGTRFTRRSNLKTHNLRKHAGVKPFVCDVCGRSFGYNTDLKEHAKIHKPRSCMCEICGKFFKKPSAVKRHKQIHRNNQTYPCTECERIFSHKNFLKMHMNAHARRNKLVEAQVSSLDDNVSK